MSSTSTTYRTFTVLTPRSISSVELYGSWDNFKSPFKMERDNRCGRGHWKGCPTDIVCEPSSETSDGHGGGGEKGLKMGATYFYYYVLDGDIEFHNPQEPSTTSCDLLPGQRINVLEVPILLPAAPDDQRGGFTGRKFVRNDESESKQSTGLMAGGNLPRLNCIRQNQVRSFPRPSTAPARLAGVDLRQPKIEEEAIHESEEAIDIEQCPSRTAGYQYEQYVEINEPIIDSPEEIPSLVEPVPKHTSKTKKLRSAFQMRPLKSALAHDGPRAGFHRKAAEGEKHRLLKIHRRPESSSKKKKKYRMARVENRGLHDWEEGRGVRHLSNIFTKSGRDDERDVVRHGHFHIRHGHLRRKLEHLAETKHTTLRRRGHPPQEPIGGDDGGRAMELTEEGPPSSEDLNMATALSRSPCAAEDLSGSREGTASSESMTSASTFEHENEALLNASPWPHPPQEASLGCAQNQLLNLRAHGVDECNNSQETVVPGAAVHGDQILNLGPIACPFNDNITIQAPEVEDVRQCRPLATPLEA